MQALPPELLPELVVVAVDPPVEPELEVVNRPLEVTKLPPAPELLAVTAAVPPEPVVKAPLSELLPLPHAAAVKQPSTARAT